MDHIKGIIKQVDSMLRKVKNGYRQVHIIHQLIQKCQYKLVGIQIIILLVIWKHLITVCLKVLDVLLVLPRTA